MELQSSNSNLENTPNIDSDNLNKLNIDNTMDIEPPKQESSLLKKVLNLVISISVVIACLYYAMQDIDFVSLKDIIVNANYLWVLLSVPVIVGSHWMRAVRWKRIVKPIKEVKSVYPLFSAVMIGYAMNAITPRGGEFVRPYSFSKREKVSYSSSFATIVVERVIDVITLFLLLAGTFIFLSHKITQALPDTLNPNRIMLYGGLIVGMIMLSFYPPIIKSILRLLVKPLSSKLYSKLLELFDKFLIGLSIIKKPKEYISLVIESISIWILYALPMYFMFFSFSFQATLGLGFDDAVLLLVVSGVISTFAPTPGALGVYHVIIQGTLVTLYNISPADALAYATLTHAINYLIQIGLGGWYFIKENSFSRTKLNKKST